METDIRTQGALGKVHLWRERELVVMGICGNRKGTQLLVVETGITLLTASIPRHFQADLNGAVQLRTQCNYIMLGDTNSLRIIIDTRY